MKKRGPTDVARLKEVGFEINLGFLKGTYKIDADATQQNAAWELYVELMTRITVVELKPEDGLLREALSSLHSIFGSTREVLRKYGPKLGRAWGDDTTTVGQLAVIYLNDVLRPVLAKWHPLLLAPLEKRGYSTANAGDRRYSPA